MARQIAIACHLVRMLHMMQIYNTHFSTGTNISRPTTYHWMLLGMNFLVFFYSLILYSSFSQRMEAARVTIMFKDSHFTATKRYELYNNTELLALCGGLLSFFFGASFLSILEIFYYFIVIPICTFTLSKILKLNS